MKKEILNAVDLSSYCCGLSEDYSHIQIQTGRHKK